MFRHILVPLDLSARNDPALETALGLAEQNRARVTLLHVIQRIEHVPEAELRPFYRRIEATARKQMDAAARRFAARKIDVRAVIALGAPARGIVEHAAVNGVDLIVLSSHKVDLSRRAQGFGTISYQVGVLCRCPVLLVK
jgi:nucleotide-binding universal stress UspA family protein